MKDDPREPGDERPGGSAAAGQDVLPFVDPPDFHLRHLRYFLAAAEDENFSVAAARLHVAQPALSRRIRDLEAALGVTLFERERKRVHLTEAGRAFYEDARQLMLDLSRAVVRTRRLEASDAGILSIGVTNTALRHDGVGRALRDFHSAHPAVGIQIDPPGNVPLLAAVRSGALDGAFIHSRPAGIHGVDYVELAHERFSIALPADHRLADSPRITLIDLRGEEFLWLPRESAPQIYDEMLNACLAGGLHPKIGQTLLNEVSRLHLVAEGMGISFVTGAFDDFHPAGVVFKEVDDFDVIMKLEFVWQDDNRSPLLAQFVDVVRAVASGRKGAGEAES